MATKTDELAENSKVSIKPKKSTSRKKSTKSTKSKKTKKTSATKAKKTRKTKKIDVVLDSSEEVQIVNQETESVLESKNTDTQKVKRSIKPPKQIQHLAKEAPVIELPSTNQVEKEAPEIESASTNQVVKEEPKKRTLRLNINFAREETSEDTKDSEPENTKESEDIKANDILKMAQIEPEPKASTTDEEIEFEQSVESESKQVAEEKEEIKNAVIKEAANSIPTFDPNAYRVVDTSVNQNASFFYESSIFERMNLKITDINDNSKIEIAFPTKKEEVQNVEKVEKKIEEIKETEKELSTENTNTNIENTGYNDNLVLEDNSTHTDNLDDVVFYTDNTSEIINEAISNSNNSENYESDAIETPEAKADDIVVDDVVDNIIKDLSVDNIIKDLSEEPTDNQLETKIEDTISPISAASSPFIEMDINSVKSFVSNKIDELFVDEINVDNINNVEKIQEQNSFFDSSIPTMQEEAAPVRTIKKIKKAPSSIFKSFTFEEANIAKAIENVNNDAIEIQGIPETIIQAPIDTVTPIITEPEISLDSVGIQNSIDNISQIPEMNISAAKPTGTVVNVITPDSKAPVLNLNDEKIEELIENDSAAEDDIEDDDDVISSDNSNSLDDLPELEDDDDIEFDDDTEKIIEEYSISGDYDYDTIKEDLEKEEKEKYNDDNFSIESYFGLDKLSDEDLENIKIDSPKDNSKKSEKEPEKIDKKEPVVAEEEKSNKKSKKESNDFSAIKNLIEGFNTSINNLSNKISALNTKPTIVVQNATAPAATVAQENDASTQTNNIIEEIIKPEATQSTEPVESDITDEASVIDKSDDISDDDLLDLLMTESDESILPDSSEEPIEDVADNETTPKVNVEEQEENSSEAEIVEDLLADVLLSGDNSSFDEDLKNSLLSEVLSTENSSNANSEMSEDEKIDSDFSKVLDCLSKAIAELEHDNTKDDTENKQENDVTEYEDDGILIPDVISAGDVIENVVQVEDTVKEQTDNQKDATTSENKNYIPADLQSETNNDGKSFNILIDKDDIFSIQILNETYEIVADFGGISIISQNIHISTPKNNFYVKIGDKYIEIHNHTDHFTVITNFEDVEFENAINNIGFAKKTNQIELNIKEAFKLSSVNNKIELSMLNKTIASIKDKPITEVDENSICDNRTLVISEETQKVYLPYTISEVMNILKFSNKYETLQEVVDNEFTVPLSTFKMPIISRFREAYRFMRIKENSSVYAAIDLAVELMFNSNLNPAVIRAAKDLKELNIYLDCLYENEVEKFDCFKIIYKVLPKIK